MSWNRLAFSFWLDGWTHTEPEAHVQDFGSGITSSLSVVYVCCVLISHQPMLRLHRFPHAVHMQRGFHGPCPDTRSRAKWFKLCTTKIYDSARLLLGHNGRTALVSKTLQSNTMESNMLQCYSTSQSELKYGQMLFSLLHAIIERQPQA